MVPLWGNGAPVRFRTLNGLPVYLVIYRRGRWRRYMLLTRRQWDLISERWFVTDVRRGLHGKRPARNGVR